jgi:hypothetical protein
MSWIKLQNSIWDNPKVDYIAEECDLPIEYVVGIVARVWSWFDQHTDNGETSRIGSAKVSRIIATSVTQLRDRDATSVTQQFIKCLIEVDWLEKKGENLALPNWEMHNGSTAKKRASDQKRQEKSRTKREAVTDVTQERDENATREEKRREEERREEPIQSTSSNFEENSREENFEDEELPDFDFLTQPRNTPTIDEWLRYFSVHGLQFGLSEEKWRLIYATAEACGWRTKNQQINNWKMWGAYQARYEAQNASKRDKEADMIQDLLKARGVNGY